MKIKKRIVIYPQDIQLITGRSERYCRNLIKKIKDQLGKEDHHYVTIDEFSDFTGLEKEMIYEFIY